MVNNNAIPKPHPWTRQVEPITSLSVSSCSLASSRHTPVVLPKSRSGGVSSSLFPPCIHRRYSFVRGAKTTIPSPLYLGISRPFLGCLHVLRNEQPRAKSGRSCRTTSPGRLLSRTTPSLDDCRGTTVASGNLISGSSHGLYRAWGTSSRGRFIRSFMGHGFDRPNLAKTQTFLDSVPGI